MTCLAKSFANSRPAYSEPTGKACDDVDGNRVKKIK
jgi:hypothetical protein